MYRIVNPHEISLLFAMRTVDGQTAQFPEKRIPVLITNAMEDQAASHRREWEGRSEINFSALQK